MTILNTSKLTFFKNEGKPLTSGYIYVGVAGQDPLVAANQKTVTFTDSAGTEATATQPIRTDTDGRIQWNGKAITASVEGSYSLLILDSNQVQINGGWTPTITPDSSTSEDVTDVTKVGLLLSDVKELELDPGDTAESIGKLVATDGLGSNWLVVSATGEAADDVDLIDFENGTQGVRILNYNVEEIELDLDGDFTGGTVKLVRQGTNATISIYNMDFIDAPNASTSVGLIPESFRPTEGYVAMTFWSGVNVIVYVQSDGAIYLTSILGGDVTTALNVSTAYVI